MVDSETPRLEVTDRFGCPLPANFVREVVAATIEFADRPELEVSILLTDEAEIAAVHEEFMDDPTPTDVISFPLDEGVDMVVSVERAQREARDRGHAFEAELALYIVHGILHVCGFDDIDAAARAAMREAEQKVLAQLGLRVSPVDE